ncbi:glycine zipper 2TM domain-containing protein [Sphingomonas sp. NBWT7]|uniref:glycine zipper 2TM domain-containing protein n=1 Tax=unclassified Sphingomonas TaxID=196159 RepID=UPI001181BC89|nr:MULTISPECIES: glycine zipper 2TM domain-containing protein [unclassified Sphingomonas]QNE32158.1 glycine zipper 2TM domain-containing protein [Sphingomonas sp. NBWT7]
MRKMLLALGASAMVLPTLVATTTEADAQRRYKYREWRGNDGRLRCRKPNGTTGLVVGGVAGALLGRTIDTRGDRTLGTLGGAAVGALAGREVERGTSSRRCR